MLRGMTWTCVTCEMSYVTTCEKPINATTCAQAISGFICIGDSKRSQLCTRKTQTNLVRKEARASTSLERFRLTCLCKVFSFKCPGNTVWHHVDVSAFCDCSAHSAEGSHSAPRPTIYPHQLLLPHLETECNRVRNLSSTDASKIVANGPRRDGHVRRAIYVHSVLDIQFFRAGVNPIINGHQHCIVQIR